jgi:hypothetical protein
MPVHHRLPRAGIDRFDDPGPALALMTIVMTHPPRHETIAVTLDRDRRGLGIVVVDGTHDPDAVIEVVECLAGAAGHHADIGGLVLATVWPDPTSRTVGGYGDVERWMEASGIAEEHGIELVEWFVIADAITCPRDRLGEPPRW